MKAPEGAQKSMQATWDKKFDLVEEMHSLSTITFDFTSLYCLSGCCRAGMVNLILGEFHVDLVSGHFGLENLEFFTREWMTIMVKGLTRDDEKELVRGLP